MKKTILTFLIIEFIVISWGITILLISNYFAYKCDLKLIKERQEGLKTHTVYKNCLEDE